MVICRGIIIFVTIIINIIIIRLNILIRYSCLFSGDRKSTSSKYLFIIIIIIIIIFITLKNKNKKQVSLYMQIAYTNEFGKVRYLSDIVREFP